MNLTSHKKVALNWDSGLVRGLAVSLPQALQACLELPPAMSPPAASRRVAGRVGLKL